MRYRVDVKNNTTWKAVEGTQSHPPIANALRILMKLLREGRNIHTKSLGTPGPNTMIDPVDAAWYHIYTFPNAEQEKTET